METSVKWNLEEAVEISVLSGMDVIQFEKSKSGESWRYWNERVSDDGVLRFRDNIRRVFTAKLPALLEKYESVGCGVLIATERKRTVLEPLKLGEKMVEVSTKKFNWDDVAKITIYRNGFESLRYESANRTDVEGMPIFNLQYRFDQRSLFTKSTSDWFVYEVENDIKQSNTTEVIIFNKDGERMNYEQN